MMKPITITTAIAKDFDDIDNMIQSYTEALYTEAVSKKIHRLNNTKKADTENESIKEETPEEVFDLPQDTSEDDSEDVSELENLDEIYERGSRKRGKKPADYTTINKLEDESHNKIAQYVGALLARSRSSKPYWTTDDILHVLNDKTFISDEFLHLLEEGKDFANSDENDLKAYAIKIKKDLISNIAEFTSEVNNILKTQPNGNYNLLQEFSEAQLKSKFKAIIDGLTLCEKSGVPIAIEYNSDQHNAFVFVDNLVKEISKDLHIVIQENKSNKDAKNRAENNSKLLTILSEIHNLEKKPLLIPNYENNISSISELKTFFSSLLSPEETERGNKIVEKYKSKKKQSDKNNEVVNEEKIKSSLLSVLIHKIALKLENQSINTEQLSKLVIKIVNEIQKIDPSIIELVEKEYESEDGESELAGLITKEFYKRNTALGRKKNDKPNEQADSILTKIFSKVKIA